MSYKLNISVFCPYFDGREKQTSPQFTYSLCEVFPSSGADYDGCFTLISPNFQKDFDSCSVLVSPLSEVVTSHKRWLHRDDPFCCIAHDEGFAEPILQLVMLNEQIRFMHNESLRKKPVQILELSFSNEDQVDKGFSVYDYSSHTEKITKTDQLVLKSEFNAHLFYGRIKMIGGFSLNEYEKLTDTDPVANWARKWSSDGSKDTEFNKSYEKMKMRFM